MAKMRAHSSCVDQRDMSDMAGHLVYNTVNRLNQSRLDLSWENFLDIQKKKSRCPYSLSSAWVYRKKSLGPLQQTLKGRGLYTSTSVCTQFNTMSSQKKCFHSLATGGPTCRIDHHERKLFWLVFFLILETSFFFQEPFVIAPITLARLVVGNRSINVLSIYFEKRCLISRVWPLITQRERMAFNHATSVWNIVGLNCCAVITRLVGKVLVFFFTYDYRGHHR